MQDVIAAIRAFNRFHTRLVGALDAKFLGTDLSLPEARLLFEIAQAEPAFAAELQASLGMDAGFVSRILARFEQRSWIQRGRDGPDARRRPITLTPEGRAAFEDLDARQKGGVIRLLADLDPAQQADLAAALGAARAMLDPAGRGGFTLRPVGPGDLGLIAARQSRFYHDAYGWGRGLEININQATTDFLRHFKPGRDQGWVAQVHGALAGSVLLTDEGEGVSRLRLFYVEPMARGLGIGDALVTACIAFARDTGQDAITLWTHTVLETARRLYARHGFRLVDTAWHDTFGVPLQGETWSLPLRG